MSATFSGQEMPEQEAWPEHPSADVEVGKLDVGSCVSSKCVLACPGGGRVWSGRILCRHGFQRDPGVCKLAVACFLNSSYVVVMVPGNRMATGRIIGRHGFERDPGVGELVVGCSLIYRCVVVHPRKRQGKLGKNSRQIWIRT